jgi:hypothetical protein
MRLWTQQLMIELADVLDRLLQFLIIFKPAANLGDPLTTHTWCPSPRAHFGQPLVCRTVRSSNEPRSSSPVAGSRPTSLSRARMVRPRIIYKNESDVTKQIKRSPSDLAVFRRQADSQPGPTPLNFAPGSS